MGVEATILAFTELGEKLVPYKIPQTEMAA
jgi:hypothetical protein